MKRTPCVVVGAGGHARVVIDALREEGSYKPIGATDPDPEKIGGEVEGVPILGDDSVLSNLRKVRHFVVGLGGGNEMRPRRKLFKRIAALGLRPIQAIHPGARVAKSASIGEGTVVFANAVVNPGARVGRNVILNTGSIVEHDVVVGDHVHLAPRSTLCGYTQVGEGSFIGTHACVIPYIKVGHWAVVGAGAVVTYEVAGRATVVGVPARAMRRRQPPLPRSAK